MANDRISLEDKRKEKVSLSIKKHPKFEDAEFIMSISKHDSVLMIDKEKKEVLARIKSVSQNIPGDPKRIYLEIIPAVRLASSAN